MTQDKTALSYWFPLIEAAGVPVPRTKIIAMPKDAQEDIWALFDGKDGPGGMRAFVETIKTEAADFGFPFFLRTDHTSGKHSWKDTCFVQDPDKIGQHVGSIAEFSECCSFIGLPWDTWVIREFLPTKPLGVCPRFGDMPICREFRYFVDDGAIRCVHPYWPKHALEQGGVDLSTFDYPGLCAGLVPSLDCLAQAAGKAVGGSWSVDILETRNGWYVTDMAEAHKSFHWEGCESPLTSAQHEKT